MASIIRENFEWGLAYSFTGSVHYHHGGKHGSIQAGMVLEELRVLHPDSKADRRDSVFFRQLERDSLLHWEELEHRPSKPTPTVTHFL